jgi:hypothetical protein
VVRGLAKKGLFFVSDATTLTSYIFLMDKKADRNQSWPAFFIHENLSNDTGKSISRNRCGCFSGRYVAI